MSDWQDISTAPKDGRHILAFQVCVADETNEDGRVLRKNVRMENVVVAYWIWGGFVQFPWNGGIPTNVTYTHWMPLPAPPQTEQAAA